MGLQFRKEGGEFYSPHRDILYLFPTMLKIAAGHVEDQVIPEIELAREAFGLEEAEVADVFGAICRLIGLIQGEENLGMQEALEKVGWYKLNEKARLVVEAAMGRLLISTFYKTTKEVPSDNTGAAANIATICAQLEESMQAIQDKPRWRTRFSRLRSRIRVARYRLFKKLFKVG